MMYGLTRSLKNEIVKIAPKGRVNSIAPGWTRTVCHIHFHRRRHPPKAGCQPLAEESLKDANVVYRALATYFASISPYQLFLPLLLDPFDRLPLKKVALTSDVASQIAILSSQTVSGHVTGEVLMITGGLEGQLVFINLGLAD